jgi:glycyl-radical enzyme activating protein
MISGTDQREIKGYVFDIQGLSVHDGPGCRTLVFLNGCTLSCFWCSNPEGISSTPGLLWFASKCIGCGHCMHLCPHQSIRFEQGKPVIHRSFCADCEEHDCLEECYTGALRLSGYEISVSKLFSLIQRDSSYWGNGGGVTLTGGEPLLQVDFAEAILRRCHDAYIHTAIETCGNLPWRNFQKVLPYLDWIFFDLKHFDNTEHKKATAADNVHILENARLLAGQFTGRLIFRLPLIPGFNDSDENIASVIRFLQEIDRTEINILPLHHLGREKYPMLGKDYLGNHHLIPSNEHLSEVALQFTEAGIKCYVGSETPF